MMKNSIKLLIIILAIVLTLSACVETSEKGTKLKFIENQSGLPIVDLEIFVDGVNYSTNDDGEINFVSENKIKRIDIPEYFTLQNPEIDFDDSEKVINLKYNLGVDFTGVITLKDEEEYIYKVISTSDYLRAVEFVTPENINQNEFKVEKTPYFQNENGSIKFNTGKEFSKEIQEAKTIFFDRKINDNQKKISFAIFGKLSKIDTQWEIYSFKSFKKIENPVSDACVIYDYNGIFYEKIF